MKLEKVLIKAIRNKNKTEIEECFNTIYDTYSNLLYFVALKKINDKQIVEELVNETFFNFFKNIKSINEEGNIKYYLLTSINNLIINYYNKKENFIHITKDIDMNSFSDNSEIENLESYEKLKKYVSQDEYEIIFLHLACNLTFKEISEIKNTSLASVAGVYKRAMDRLRKTLKRGDLYE